MNEITTAVNSLTVNDAIEFGNSIGLSIVSIVSFKEFKNQLFSMILVYDLMSDLMKFIDKEG